MYTIPITEHCTLLPKQTGSRFSNEGATAQVNIRLPPCAPNLEFEFVIVEPLVFQISCHDIGTETIIYQQGSSADCSAQKLRYSGRAGNLRLVGLNDSQWAVMGVVASSTWDEQ